MYLSYKVHLCLFNPSILLIPQREQDGQQILEGNQKWIMTLSSIKHGAFMLYYTSSNMRNPSKTKPDLIALIIW